MRFSIHGTTTFNKKDFYKTSTSRLFLFSSVFFLASCGGESDGSSSSTSANAAPVASSVGITDTNAGTAEVGDGLTGDYTYSDAEGDVEGATTYRWLRNGVAIFGATANTYTLVSADSGLNIIFEVAPAASTGTVIGSGVLSAAIAVDIPAGDNVPTASSVSITDDNAGTVNVGDSLTGSYVYADVEGAIEGATSFRWLRGGVAISGATLSTYTLVDADSGLTITFEVTPIATSGNTTGVAVVSGGINVISSVSVLDASHFRAMISATTVACTLSNGSSTTCHELKFNVNNIKDGTTSAAYDDEAGPYCPSTKTSTDGGLGSYDGADPGVTHTIFVMNSTLWNTMEADGYDLFFGPMDSICTSDLFAGTSTGACPQRCLENSTDDALVATFLIPVTPQLLASDDSNGEIEHVGVSLDGVPFTGTPPFVSNNGGNIPALDHCGGHVDPFGYYHHHFITEAMDTAITGFGLSLVDASCTITQDDDALFGYAKDGYPIYSTKDFDGSTPADLDSCNGHIYQTNEFSSGVYHYHAVSQTNSPNFPPCLKGASVDAMSTPVIN